MKKEYIFIVTISLFIFSYILSSIAGPIAVKVTGNPYTFLFDQTNLNRIPLTSFEILVKSIAIFLSIGLVLSLFEKNYFTKAIVVFITSLLTQLYAIQQIMTKGTLTSMQWTLSLAYAGSLALIYLVYFIFQGIVYGINNKLIEKNKKIEEKNDESTVLKPE